MDKVTLLEDLNNKPGKHVRKNEWWQANGIEVIRQRLPVGDYILVNDKVQDVLDRKAARGVPVKMMDLIGTYNVVCDSKKDIQELIGDICGKSHARFKDELLLAQNNGIKLYILVEDDGGYVKKGIYNKPVRCLQDLFSWKNPRLFIWRQGKQLYPTATKGATLAKVCITIEQKYGCKFVFCSHADSAKVILDLLIGGDNP